MTNEGGGATIDSIKYYQTTFIEKSRTDDETRFNLVSSSTEMICLREDAFNEIELTADYKIFCNKQYYVAIVFDVEAITQLKHALGQFKNSNPVHIYIFSLSNDAYATDFSDLGRKYELRPIPESILEIYERIFQKSKGGA